MALAVISVDNGVPMSLPVIHVRARFYRPQLDVVRFAAFLAVFAHHTIPRTGTHSLVEICADSLGFGLCLFFVLSAYLITLLLLRERDETGSIHLLPFYARRILRIWPLYLLGLAIGVARSYHHGVLQQDKGWFLAALLLAGNLVYPGGILMSHLWSISIEEQFYLFFPTVCRNLGRRGMFAVALVLIALANVTLIHYAHVHADLDVRVWFSSFVQFEMFAAGILLALAGGRLPRWGVSGSMIAVLSAAGMWLIGDSLFHLKQTGLLAQSAPSVCLGYGLVAISCCLLITGLQGLPSPQALVYSGRISYGLYVFHIPAIALVGSRISGPWNPVASLALTYCLAAVSYRYFESPFLKLKSRFEMVSTLPLDGPPAATIPDQSALLTRI